jgi:hypothetical protein
MEQEIESVLRAAPRPAPPAGLKERLIAEVRVPAAQTAASLLTPASWLRRWWPVLVPASVSLACAAALTVQQMEIRDLKQAIQDLARDSAAKARTLSAPAPATNSVPAGPDAAARTQQEIARLKGLAGQLAAEVAQLEQMRAENGQLRAQLAEPPAGLLTPEDAEALAQAKEKVESIRCINKMKQIGLSVRTYMIDSEGITPPDMLSMSNELSTPKVLACPGDHAREAAKDWASYTTANCSYEYLVRSESKPDREPTRVAFRCPIHGHLGLIDGSVQGYVAKQHPEQLVQRGGKLYFEPSAQPAQAAPAVQPGNPPPGDPPPGGSSQ